MKMRGRCVLSGAVLSALLLLAGCNSQKREAAESHPTHTLSGCYVFAQHRDSIKLSIRQSGTGISGTLDFLFYEKDKSRGTIEGEMKGDTLFAGYRFRSEGLQSEREVVFLRRGDTFVLGAGETERIGNKDVFRDQREISFDTRVVLAKTSRCD